MKKLILTGAFLLSISLSFGQKTLGVFYLPQRTSISNSINDKDDPIFQNKTTFGGGAGINITFWKNDVLGLQVGLMYISHNQKFISKYKDLSYADSMRTYKGKKRLDYLKLPILAVTSLPVSKQFNLFGYAGPQFAYLLKGDGAVVIYRHYGDGISDFFDLPPSGSHFYKKFLVDMVLGGGFNLKLAPELSISASLRFDYSLTDVENKDAEAYENYPLYTYGDPERKKAHNSSLGLMLCFNYHLGCKADLIRPGGKR
jgi:hypothetical protein